MRLQRPESASFLMLAMHERLVVALLLSTLIWGAVLWAL